MGGEDLGRGERVTYYDAMRVMGEKLEFGNLKQIEAMRTLEFYNASDECAICDGSGQIDCQCCAGTGRIAKEAV